MLSPCCASAHGIVGKADLPIPVWLFSWTAAVVLVVSFVALSTLWRWPQLQERHARRLLSLPRRLEPLANLAGLALFALVLYSGFAGAQEVDANLAPTFIYVVFWVGFPIAGVLLGDVFPLFSPWRTSARLIRRLLRALAPGRWSQPPLRYPDRLGMWPAAIVLTGFGWLELVYLYRDVPATLAALASGYFAFSLTGMVLFGVERWERHADGFAVYFGLLARLAPVCYRDGEIRVRRPLSGLTGMPIEPGTLAVIFTVIGTTTFDGLSNGGYWKELALLCEEGLDRLGVGQNASIELVYTAGLLGCILLVGGVYRLGIRGVGTVAPECSRTGLARTFAHTLVPIGFAYVLAHYFSFVLWQGQAMAALISDPLGNGANLFGTAGSRIDYRIVSYAAIWYVQVAALLAGHVGGLALAHDRALTIFPDPEEAVRSQYWMLAVMVAFTSFGLWLLSAVGT